MTALSEFSLEKHSGPYESWPEKSRLLRMGQPTPLSLPGYSLLHQFRTCDGFLFITDDDCPMEEVTHFILCDAKLRPISSRFVGWAYCSFILERVEWIDARHMLAVFDHDDSWMVTLRTWGIPYLLPRLKVTRLQSPNQALQAPATPPRS